MKEVNPTERLLADAIEDLEEEPLENAEPIGRWDGEIGTRRLAAAITDLVRRGVVGQPELRLERLTAEGRKEASASDDDWSACAVSESGVRYRYRRTGNGRYSLLLNSRDDGRYRKRFTLSIAGKAAEGAWTLKNEQTDDERRAGWSQVCAQLDGVEFSGEPEVRLRELSVEESV